MNILVSACLLGIPCRYDGTGTENSNVITLATRHSLVPVCPEQLGGLTTPRRPVELRDGRAVADNGQDMTPQFLKGAEAVAKIAQLLKCSHAILKQKSPSCGCGKIYDGSFSQNTIPGDGLTTKILKKQGVTVLADDDVRGSELMPL